MSAFRTWYITHQDAISWFVIGACAGQCVDALAVGNYNSAAISFIVGGANYVLTSYKMKL